jgi:hypothetical protein
MSRQSVLIKQGSIAMIYGFPDPGFVDHVASRGREKMMEGWLPRLQCFKILDNRYI